MDTPKDQPNGLHPFRMGNDINYELTDGNLYGASNHTSPSFRKDENFKLYSGPILGSMLSVLGLPIYSSSSLPPMTSPTRFGPNFNTTQKQPSSILTAKPIYRLPPPRVQEELPEPPPLPKARFPTNEKSTKDYFTIDDLPTDSLDEFLSMESEAGDEIESDDEDDDDDETSATDSYSDDDSLEEYDDSSDIGVLLRPSRRKDTGYIDLRSTVPPTMCARPYKYIIRFHVPFDHVGVEGINKDSFHLDIQECPKSIYVADVERTSSKKKKFGARRKKKSSKHGKFGQRSVASEESCDAVKMDFLRELSDREGSIYDFNVQFFRSSFLNKGMEYRIIASVKSKKIAENSLEILDEDVNDDRPDELTQTQRRKKKKTKPKKKKSRRREKKKKGDNDQYILTTILRSRKFSLVARKVKERDDLFWDMYPESGITGFKRKKRPFTVDTSSGRRKRRKRRKIK